MFPGTGHKPGPSANFSKDRTLKAVGEALARRRGRPVRDSPGIAGGPPPRPRMTDSWVSSGMEAADRWKGLVALCLAHVPRP